jgi:hypothetical protein
MKLFYIILFAFTFVCSDGHSGELDNKSNAELEHLCDNANFTSRYQCSQFIEKSQIPKYSSYIRRRGEQLIIHLRNGNEIALKDINPGESGGKSYSFRTYLKRVGYFLFEVAYWEGGAFVLVNDSSGKEVVIDHIPIISPDRKRFITASFDIEARYNPNRIQIYRLASIGPMLEWSFEPSESWGPVNPKWINNEEIKLEKATLAENGYKYSPLTLIFRNNIWNLKD